MNQTIIRQWHNYIYEKRNSNSNQQQKHQEIRTKQKLSFIKSIKNNDNSHNQTLTSYFFHSHKLFYNYIILSIKTKIKHFYWHYKNNKYHDIIDPCVLTSDADANPNFTHYTSIFLNSNNLLSFDYEYEYYENIRIYFHNNNNDDNNIEDDSTNSRIVNGNEILFINEKDYKVRKKYQMDY